MHLDGELSVSRVVAYPVRARDLMPRAKSVWLLILVHLVGGIGVVWQPHLFARLVPLHLLFCSAIWFLNQPTWRASLALWLAGCGAIGFAAEVVGVKTALLFGSYAYGKTLGPMLLEVPLMMAVNWTLLTAVIADVSADLASARGWGPVRGALCGSFGLVALDGLLEPFAIRYDLWQWSAGSVPVQNYAGWALVSFVLLLPCHMLKLRPQNPVSGWLLLLLFLFFGLSLLVGSGAS